ncbi:molybdopterin-guanine dinucleotide biosynthesis protein A [Sporomusaceae bacterium BoRhaA]|uniref:molybdenum cofactor guanylyltransferase n=1 Tax=Pelorhabdus rhamnosifermentans TaxID=2772457 RepID=UPI001C062980|nr:molybdenum cofactor guanylyltransferase [Pelorhabdus rhamnosifermentans]MBU2702361.1 molybdopterin-guanine dinucleotide biosynthesis protein A [Pelorhabdus rhamnosifermentans]
MMKASGIILAGGHSSRMGRDKTLLKANRETLIERTVRVLGEVSDDLVIASNNTNKYDLPGVTEVVDIYPEMGPLGGIHAGLLMAKYENSLVVSGDMPFLTADLLCYLLQSKQNYDVVVPEFDGKLEPLCAVYSKRCIEPIEACLRSDMRKVQYLYERVRVYKVHGEKLVKFGDLNKLFFNLNTPADLALAKEFIS